MSALAPDSIPLGLVVLWHTYRLEFIIFAGLLVAAVSLLQYKGTRRSDAHQGHITIETKELKHSHDVTKALRDTQNSNATRTIPARPLSQGPRRINGKTALQSNKHAASSESCTVLPLIFYFTISGSTGHFARQVAAGLADISKHVLPPRLHDLAEIDYDEFFISPPKLPDVPNNVSFFYIFLVPTYDIDTELSNFISNLTEIHNDFRIDTAPLSSLAGYAVLGFGSSSEWIDDQVFCTQAFEVDRWMSKLSAGRRAYPIGTADTNACDTEDRVRNWQHRMRDVLKDIGDGKGLGEGVLGSGDPYESGDEGSADDDLKSQVPKLAKRRKVASGADLEDIKPPIPVDFTSMSSTAKPMVPVSSPTYTALTKQGYSIVGSHSGVKICRWTKSALRGRGSCYKFSFYGIASHRCMEATPSLSCSNKCVFCWRHGTNPVGTTWRWQVDPPELIFDGIKKEHYRKIKMLKGVPGVRAERFEEGLRIRHCALSLVGEPIFYPHINELLGMLHQEHISSFLVCNAQHPDQLASLGPVTQLYVSIDASNKESLRRIDRPLHRDFWERFIRCMDILRQKRNTHRTVFRLTLVKGFNIDEEAEGYADLVERALPSFVEVKGVTYCGTSTATGAGLTMQNVPFYEEVTAFVLALEAALLKRGLDYGIGAEHAHSCCILLADRKRYFKVPAGDNGSTRKWHTLIDYDRFFALLESGQAFGPEDYIGQPTAEWALWGNGGFDPRDARVDRKGRPKQIA